MSLAILLLLTAIPAFAQHVAKGDSEAGVSGQQVAKDPATGKFRPPTAEELKVLAPPANNDSADGLVVRTLPSGAQMVDLEGRFQNYSVARKEADGKVRTGCVTNAKEAGDFLKNDAGKAPAKPSVQQSDPSTWEVK